MSKYEESTYLYALTADPGKPLREAKQEIQRLNEQVTILRAERDQARREVCKLEAELPEKRLVVWNAARMPKNIATERSWDCFDREQGK